MDENKEKIAVILFNLGAPDNMQAVRPFLFNLFFDKNIIRLPYFLRLLLAFLISYKRTKTASEIYKILGGKSPLLENTEKQRVLLQEKLNKNNKIQTFQCFISMRYWHPMAKETVKQVKSYAPDKIILLPLYPQYSTTTTNSSFQVWHREAQKIKLNAPCYQLCCYPTNQKFTQNVANLVEDELKNIKNKVDYRILFSAHGLPKNIVAQGDPYCWQIEQTVTQIASHIKNIPDWIVCYQSRVGPLEWVQPYTEDQIMRAGTDKKSIIMVPVAFVSEHSETLVELDHEYRELAEEHAVKEYIRVPTVSEGALFIDGLAQEVTHVLEQQKTLICSSTGLKCPAKHTDCPHQIAQRRNV